MPHYKVVLEIEVDAENPLEASKTVQRWVKEDESNFQYYVQEDEPSAEIVSVDLTEADADAILPADDYRPMIG